MYDIMTAKAFEPKVVKSVKRHFRYRSRLFSSLIFSVFLFLFFSIRDRSGSALCQALYHVKVAVRLLLVLSHRRSCDFPYSLYQRFQNPSMAILKMYAADNGFSNTVYYVDDVVLGTTFERDGFKAMMTDIEEGKS